MNNLRKIWRACPLNAAAILCCLVALPLSWMLQSMTTGMRFFWFFVRFILAVATLYNLCSVCIVMHFAEKTMRVFRRLARIAAGAWLASFLTVLCCLIAAGQPEHLTSADDPPAFITVLGAGLNGTEPSLILRNRLDRAIELSQTYPEAKLILCGGLGYDHVITEAEAMQHYLIRNGVDPARLILEDTSRDTAENLQNAKRLMDQIEGEGKHQSWIVTCSFHMMRSKLLAERYGIDPVAAPVPTRPQEYHYYLREYFSLMIYLIEETGLTIDTSGLNL